MAKQNPYQTPYEGVPMGQSAPQLDRGGMGGGIANLMRMLMRKREMGGGVQPMQPGVPEVNPMDDFGDGSENSLQKLLALRRGGFRF